MRPVREQPRLALARVPSAISLVAMAIGAVVRGDDGGVSQQSLRNWVRQEQVERRERDDGLTSDERSELIELRRRVKRLEKEKQIPEQAAALFVAETEIQ